MPRDDIHNADDLANVIRREVHSGRIVVTNMVPGEVPTDRSLAQVMATMNLAIKGTIGPELETDLDLLSGRRGLHNRVSAPIQAAAATARFRR